VAIKHIKNIVSDTLLHYTAREIEIMSQLSKMKGNIFTVQLRDIIIPGPKDSFTEVFLVMSLG
jgi:hypothetical protein